MEGYKYQIEGRRTCYLYA